MDMNSKKKAQQRHSRRRARERFDFSLDKNSLHSVIKQIQSGEAKFVKKQSLRVKHWLVKLPSGSYAVAVYDKVRKSIITFLTTEMAGVSIENKADIPLEDNTEQKMKELEYPESLVRKLARNNYAKIYISEKCGCYHCCRIFDSHLVKEWCDKGEKTAICPICGVDSVIPDTPELPLTEEFLKKQCDFWFSIKSRKAK